MLVPIYRTLTHISAPLLRHLLRARLRAGKEDSSRIGERSGVTTLERPDGGMIGMVHAASVGEAQSALILINRLLASKPDLNILVTTGTLTSAEIMAKNLPERAFHQFYPLDHPRWVARFLDHWQPDFVLWMESELWPNMLGAIKKRGIPAILVNARMSDSSYKKWRLLPFCARSILSSFNAIIAQTPLDNERFKKLGHKNVSVSGNIKYSASPLLYDDDELSRLQKAIGERPLWLYASTHKGEEEIACRVHKTLRKEFPDLLTIIVPRHPERRDEIIDSCSEFELNIVLRSEKNTLPTKDTDIYIADTLGELGLFYRLCPIAMIGRSLSDDGGGGHNPIEATQLNCAVLYGRNVQYQEAIFQAIKAYDAALCVSDEKDLMVRLYRLLSSPNTVKELQKNARYFAEDQDGVIERVIEKLAPVLPFDIEVTHEE